MAIHVEVILGQDANPDQAIAAAMQGLQNRWRLAEEKFETVLGYSTWSVDNRLVGGPFNLCVSIIIEEPKIVAASAAPPGAFQIPVVRGR